MKRLWTATVLGLLFLATAVSPALAISPAKIIGPPETVEPGGVPSFIHEALSKMPWTPDASFNTYEWDKDKEKLVVHVHGDSSAFEKQLAEVLDADWYIIERDLFSRSEIEEEGWRLASAGTVIAGSPIRAAGPNANSSALHLLLDEALVAPGSQLPNKLPHLTKFPLEIEIGAPFVASSRSYDPDSPHWGGAKMSTPVPDQPGKFRACTTGLGVGYMDGSQLVTSLLTADHCGGTGSAWRTGVYDSSPILGTMQDTSAVGADLKRLSGAEFGPVFYWGSSTSNLGAPVSGAVNPVLHDSYCYSGAPSGTVCDNDVRQLNMTLCYLDIPPLCYRNMAITDQLNNVPAAGQGDSGGPAVKVTSDKAYASGIISGIHNGSTECNENSDGRLCSKTVVVAPIAAFFQDNPQYGILTTRPSTEDGANNQSRLLRRE